MLVAYQDRKHRQLAASHKSSCEASRRAECGKSARSVRRGGEWKPATVRLLRHSQRKRGATDRPDLRVWRHSSTLSATGRAAPPVRSGCLIRTNIASRKRPGSSILIYTGTPRGVSPGRDSWRSRVKG